MMRRFHDLEKNGKRIEVFANEHELRDYFRAGYERCQVPSRISVCPKGAPTQRDEVMRGLYSVEQTMGTSHLLRNMGLGLNADQVKRVWEKP